jgi:hypothetical protein
MKRFIASKYVLLHASYKGGLPSSNVGVSPTSKASLTRLERLAEYGEVSPPAGPHTR